MYINYNFILNIEDIYINLNGFLAKKKYKRLI